MDYETRLKNKHHNSNEEKDKERRIKYFRGLITRSLLAIIMVLGIVIFTKMDSANKELVNKYFFSDTLNFTEINNYFHDKFGSVVPQVPTNEALVFSSRDIKNYDYELVGDHYEIKVNKGSTISSLCGGIVVFLGEKDNLGNTVIVQGNDGVDIWYGGINNTNISLYDYVEKDTILGESSNDYLNLKLMKDGKNYAYDKYLE